MKSEIGKLPAKMVERRMTLGPFGLDGTNETPSSSPSSTPGRMRNLDEIYASYEYTCISQCEPSKHDTARRSSWVSWQDYNYAYFQIEELR
ncbi:unnamed protein product [Dovyalis caffra]|uniref:Uncharacterized protein n=1 Tax=Dovyalis caffra TaxID=77055 RepID=A0AAV1QPJ7_9ROSI|nr:unnamed protein product [Dovyalis caffra]